MKNNFNIKLFRLILFIIFIGTHNLISAQSIQKLDNSKSKEFFKMQPGAIVNIVVQNDSTWVFTIDLLTRNPDWLPGNDSTPFFNNKNPKVRSLIVTKYSTKTYKCNGAEKNGILTETSVFIAEIQKLTNIRKSEEEKSEVKIFRKNPFEYTAYFDIEGTNITAMYEQCLP